MCCYIQVPSKRRNWGRKSGNAHWLDTLANVCSCSAQLRQKNPLFHLWNVFCLKVWTRHQQMSCTLLRCCFGRKNWADIHGDATADGLLWSVGEIFTACEPVASSASSHWLAASRSGAPGRHRESENVVLWGTFETKYIWFILKRICSVSKWTRWMTSYVCFLSSLCKWSYRVPHFASAICFVMSD